MSTRGVKKDDVSCLPVVELPSLYLPSLWTVICQLVTINKWQLQLQKKKQ